MTLKNRLMALGLVVASMGMLVTSMDVDARRLGGGRPAGMQRQMPVRQPAANPSPTPNQAAPQNAAAPMAAPGAQPGRRSWMGPLAGVAAGLGIAALMSHFGMGAAMGNFVTMALLAVAAVFVIGWLMRRFSGANAQAGPQLAGAGAPYQGAAQPMYREQPTFTPGGVSAVQPAAAPLSVPPGFDAVGFERIAKMIFIRLQAANDEANIEDIRKFTTPELFASLRLDLQERGTAKQQTDVVQLDAELVDATKESSQWIASVRFSGLIREEANAGAQPFNELWHLVKPLDDSRDWAIAGITPIDPVA